MKKDEKTNNGHNYDDIYPVLLDRNQLDFIFCIFENVPDEGVMHTKLDTYVLLLLFIQTISLM